jgi:quercetin dioxygenase-like cupin family protein
MRILDVPFSTVDWSSVPPAEHVGDSGASTWRTVETGNVRVRMVTYSPGYVADHWCERGHVVLVLDGAMLTELKDGRIFKLRSGMSYSVADGQAHRSRTDGGARLFIVD